MSRSSHRHEAPIARSPAFAAQQRSGEWELREIITRLGFRQIGSIAAQIKLINSFVRTGESRFDLRRFWEHALATATVARELYSKRLLQVNAQVSLDDLWIAGLLHDVGKLVLGCFFRDWYENIQERTRAKESTFRQTEAELGDVANHERIAEILMLHSRIDPRLVTASARHHSVGKDPGSLACLVHLANGLSKEMGMGCMPNEKPVYSAAVLSTLEMKREDITALTGSLDCNVVNQIEDMVRQCL